MKKGAVSCVWVCCWNDGALWLFVGFIVGKVVVLVNGARIFVV